MNSEEMHYAGVGTVHRDFKISTIDPRLYGSFIEPGRSASRWPMNTVARPSDGTAPIQGLHGLSGTAALPGRDSTYADGHLPAVKAVFDMPAFKSLPHRDNIAKIAETDHALPAEVQRQFPIQDIIGEEVGAAVNGDMTVDEALATAESVSTSSWAISDKKTARRPQAPCRHTFCHYNSSPMS